MQVAWNTEDAAQAAREALTVLGMPGKPFHLLRLGENALYKVECADLLLRVARPITSRDRVRRSLVAARMLGAQGIPVAQPAALSNVEEPLILSTGIVSAWRFYPSAPASHINFNDFGGLLRNLHDHGPDVASLLDDWDPIAPIRRRLLSAAEIGAPRPWTDELYHRLNTIEQDLELLDPILSVGIIHGDAHTGNILSTEQGLVIIDLDDLCTGPREVDLIPTLVQLRRFSVTEDDWASFVEGYGMDDPSLLDSSPLASLRELHMTVWLLQQYGLSEELDKELELRISTLHERGGWTRWHPR